VTRAEALAWAKRLQQRALEMSSLAADGSLTEGTRYQAAVVAEESQSLSREFVELAPRLKE
jgi:transketolase N-terminal domain/subunit